MKLTLNITLYFIPFSKEEYYVKQCIKKLKGIIYFLVKTFFYNKNIRLILIDMYFKLKTQKKTIYYFFLRKILFHKKITQLLKGKFMKKSYINLIFIGILGFFISFPLPSYPLSDGQDVKNVFIIGIFPRRNARKTLELFTPLARELSQTLKREVRLETSKDFADFWQQVESGRYDLVHYNQFHYVKSHHDYGYQVIAQNEESAQAHIRSIIVVRKDSGIQNIQDLRGKTVMFGGGKQAMMSYIAPHYLLRQNGLLEADYQSKLAKNPLNALFAMYHQQAEAACIGDAVLDLPAVKQRISVDKLHILLKTEELSHLPWAVNKRLSIKERERVQRYLLNLKNDEKGQKILQQAQLSALNPASDSDFDMHRVMIEAVYGVDY